MIHRLSATLLARLPLSLSRAILGWTACSVNDSGGSPKQLLIDISELIKQDAGTGIQRVVRGIVPYLMEHPPTGYAVYPVFAEKGRGYRYAPVTTLLLQADEQKRRDARPVTVNGGDIFLGLDLVVRPLPRHRGQLLCWKRRGAKFCFLVHDLLPLLHPQWFNPRRCRTFNRWLRTIVLFGDDLICVSEAVKADLRQWLTTRYNLHNGAPRLSTVPLGADITSTMPSSGCTDEELELMDRFSNKPFILMVGTLEPRKGYTQALNAFEQLWVGGQDIPLVIVGKPGWKTEALQERLARHPEDGKRLFWFFRGSDELLQRLYHSATGVLAASEAEGYGLPLIEAAEHGKPVLARDIPVFREVAVPGTSFFEAGSFVESLEAWIRKIQEPGIVNAHSCRTSWAESATKFSETVTGMAR